MSDFDIAKEAKAVQALSVRLEVVRTTHQRNKNDLKKAEERLEQARQAQEILQHLSMAVQQRAHAKISEVVSSCLAAVFDDPYQFKIIFDRKRGRTEASLRFTRRDLDVDPLTASGGGMVDVAAFALRVACLALHRPRLSRIIVLDEPFRFVSAQYQGNIRAMLEGLSKDMKIQVVMVTHNDSYATGKVIEL